MNHTLGVGGRETVGNLPCNRRRSFERQGSVGEHLAQRATFYPLHRDPRHVVGHADVVDRDDGGVIERRCGARLALEPAPARGIGHEPVRDDLQRHIPPEPQIAGTIHLAHAPGAEQGFDGVRPELMSAFQHG